MPHPHYIEEANEFCRNAGMDPDELSRPKNFLDDAGFQARSRSYKEILSVVRFFSEKLLDSLAGTPILVVVSDANGYLLSVEGDETIKSTITELGITPGSLFKIEDTGTNVVSLSLQQPHPISIIGDQHYHTFLHGIACYGSAFRYMDEQQLLGSLSIMMPIDFQNPLFLSMLAQVVDTIERELQLRKQNRKLLILNQIMLSRTRNGIVVTDEHGITLEFNDFAQQLSGNAREDVVGRNIQDSPLTGNYFAEVLNRGAVFENEELKFLDGTGNPVVCLFDAQPIYQGGTMIGAFGQFRDITDRYLLQEQYNYLAYHDDLTDLPNRRFLNKQLEEVIPKLADGRVRNAALLFLDLDRFKVINDNFGHSYGDQLLQQVSRRLLPFVRKSDVLARMGGDEFILLLTGFTSCDDVTALAHEMCRVLEEPIVVNGRELITTASIGVALYPDYPITKEQFLLNADNAMYEAKSLGKNRYVVHTPELLESMKAESSLTFDLRRAVEEEEFILHYQPQVHNWTGELVGFEALVRWEHPSLGLLPPDRFIDLAEESGLITLLGEWVLEEACKRNKQWQDEGRTPVKMSVNLSAQQFMTRNIVGLVRTVLTRTGLEPRYLVIEITEYMAMDYNYAVDVLHDLKALGVGISIDDFGTGYSSLNHLKNLPIDYIKVDKSFVDELTDDNNDAIIVNAIISMAHSLKKEVIAEGVETAEQLESLKQQYCDISQGFLFGKPLPAAQIESSYYRPTT
ncbi:putative bifunctional diguanylate cyclase/phosphodiesterase [Sporosarcina trichiuri]|uniref:putative bifunctional diguanylate cyclase/phosphodiesterase n=1 Tax=Sporosarcina trichiuri TaxID=3056445 RepID=UPI0025B29E69|nr:EAL domain-containing protein [Sporosarcina sp. 0.2-SM1T-5]WJY26323.1 EAL domain-containing protein [Sporosarcina sp. 0.2-SM1T-5]